MVISWKREITVGTESGMLSSRTSKRNSFGRLWLTLMVTTFLTRVQIVFPIILQLLQSSMLCNHAFAKLIKYQVCRYRKKQEYSNRVEGLGYETLFLFFASLCWLFIGRLTLLLFCIVSNPNCLIASANSGNSLCSCLLSSLEDSIALLETPKRIIIVQFLGQLSSGRLFLNCDCFHSHE